ncbi:MAG: right-handed parallel beta-helix repeat-containing protein [Gammaproteobacteria bacterium]
MINRQQWSTHPRALVQFILIASALALGGCAAQTDDGIVAGPILTGTSDAETAEAATALPRTIAIMPLSNETDSELAIDVVRQTLTNHFGSRNYRVVHTGDVNQRLTAAGYTLDGKGLPELSDLRRITGADGIITGSVTHYDKTFAGVAARISVGVSLTLHNGADELVWETEGVKRSYAGGVSTSPVGLIVNALTAAKHIYGDANLYRAADELGRSLATSMPSPASLGAQTLPTISTVVHSGVNQRLNYGDTLSIGLEGDPGLSATALIPEIGLVGLSEAEPGQYVGEITIDNTLNLDQVAITGRLENEQGVASSFVSPFGLLTVDNEAPSGVTELSVVSRDGGVQLTWTPSSSADARQVVITTPDGNSVSASAMDSTAVISGLTNFADSEIVVAVEDIAGNLSQPQRLIGIAAPDPRFATATDADNVLPAFIRGVQRLRASRSPYYLGQPTTIATDGALIIEPGTVIELSKGSKLTVLGAFAAYGTKAAPIQLATKNNSRVGEFLVLSSATPSHVAGLSSGQVNLPIQVTSGAPDLIDNTLDQTFNAIVVSGASKPTLRGNVISRATAAGVIVSDQAQPIFESNTFTDNEPFHIQNGSTFPINVKGNAFSPAASPMTILGASISDES